MKRRNTLDPNEEKDLAEGATKVVMEAPRDDLWTALREAGVQPERLAEKGRRVARDVLARFDRSRQEAKRNEEEVHVLHEGLGMLVQLLRRRERLSPQHLAAQARVDVDEIRKIETDPKYSPNPRTVYQLEQRFKLPPRTLVKLVASTSRHSAEFTQVVTRFAANAKAMTSLSKDEQKLVNAFVEFLVSKGDEGGK